MEIILGTFTIIGGFSALWFFWDKLISSKYFENYKINNLYNKFKSTDLIKWIDGPHSIHSFGYTISRPHNLALAGHIQLKGINTSKSEIIVKKAYLRSLVTGEEINAEIENLKAENLEICRDANFTVIMKFPNEDGTLANNNISGISFESFLKRFSNFEIIIETNKKTYKIEFNSNETKEWISSVQIGLMMPPPSEKAKVLKRAHL